MTRIWLPGFRMPLTVLGIVLAGALGFGLSQSRLPGVPIHATAKTSGNGWQCDAGYLELGAGCFADVPDKSDRRPAIQSRTAARDRCETLFLEDAKLREMVDDLSLQNAVLKSKMIKSD